MNGAGVHFVGVGGIGMSALARLLLAEGIGVSGSDVGASPLIESLRAAGAAIAIGHRAENLCGSPRVVVSSAIAAENIELIEAKKRGLAIITRGELLAEMMNRRKGIAIAGTHGKTTTTAMIARIVQAAGLDPMVLIGGEDVGSNTNAVHGRGEYFVSESDESDGSFLALRPHVGVVTNIELDHVDRYHDLAALVVSFRRFVDQIEPAGAAVIGIDNPTSATLARSLSGQRVLTTGFSGEANLRGESVGYMNFGTHFLASEDATPLGAFDLRVPGLHNVQNALTAIGAARAIGISAEAIRSALAEFRGVRRRFEIVAESERMIVVDDYAHHPTAVSLTIAAAREYFAGPIVAAFQPHRYSRTAQLAAGFAEALGGADQAIVTSVYGAGEAPIDGVDGESIAGIVRASGKPCAYVPDVMELPAYLLDTVPAGALVLMLGAGTITRAAAELARAVGAGSAAAR